MVHRRYRQLFLLLALLMMVLPARAQTVLYNYQCTSETLDVTQSDLYWMGMTGSARQLPRTDGVTTTGPINIGFDFYYMGETFRTIEINSSGRVYFGNYTQGSDEMCIQPFCDSLQIGMSGSVNTLVSGTEGQRIFVCGFSQVSRSASTAVVQWQLQLAEADNSVRIVMKESSSSTRVMVGNAINMYGKDREMLSVNVSQGTFDIIRQLGYPVLWPLRHTRYVFTFTPVTLCGHPTGVSMSHVTDTTVRLSWHPVGNAVGYLLEYGPPGFTSGTVIGVTQNECTLLGLSPSTRYEVRVRSECINGQESDTISRKFYTLCGTEGENPFVYWNLYDSTVLCYTGTRTDPSLFVRVVDSGSSSMYSRHTVHDNTTERDPRTGNGLRTIPEGYCYSVRLGNWRARGEQEAITYKVTVDTGKSDLLLLRYAIVEENPSHPPADQPYFIFSISDQQGHLINSCLQADFVAGDLSGWNTWGDVVWHDWMAVGVDLTPLHGQEIQIKLDNADCTMGAHYGYAYFVLEYAKKHLGATSCGEDAENTFTAPAGFAYRWYNADSASVTLSTSRQLHVTASGLYCCRATYLHTSNNCGFTLTTRAGPRYPVARFTMEPVNSCGSEVHFVNQSVVAIDSARQHLTNEPCETYLWQFDDGTTSTLTSPTHTFMTAGTHTVTLTAMLANGTCSHSHTSSFTITYPNDTSYAVVCPGTIYMFYGNICVDSGLHSFTDACGPHWLNLVYRVNDTLLRHDTLCMGDTSWVGDIPLTISGQYNILLTDFYGCDSMVHEDLTVHPTYFHIVEDTLPTGSFLPVGDSGVVAPGTGWFNLQTVDGCDSVLLVALSCIQARDTTVCVDAMPMRWQGILFTEESSDTLKFKNVDGCDSLEVRNLYVRQRAHPPMAVSQSCSAPKHYQITLSTNGYTYQWTGVPVIELSAREILDSLDRLHFYPTEDTRLSFLFDYADAPSCPGTDTVLFTLQDYAIYLDLEVQPRVLSPGDQYIKAHDKSLNIVFRQWVVDSVVQRETGPWLEYEVPPQADSVLVVLIGGDSTCVDTAWKVVPVIKENLFFPNVFTPERDDNNLFRVLGSVVEDFELWIYDRRGVLMFHTTDRQKGWDGTSGGIPCPQGTYTYICRYSLPIHQPRSRKGTVTLLR